MSAESKSVLDRITIGADKDPPSKDDSSLALWLSAAACAGLGGVAGACTGGYFRAERLLTGAAIGGVSGLVLSLVGGKLKTQLKI